MSNIKPDDPTENYEHKVYDPIEKCIGTTGRFQIMIFVALTIARLPTDYQLCNVVFLIPPVDYVCEDPGANVTSPCPCESPQYDTSVFESSVGTAWNLICDKSWLLSLSQSLFHIGILFGSVIFSAISDRYGRKIAVITALITVPIAVALSALVPEYWMFAVLRFLTGAGVGGTMLCCYTLLIELIGKSFRPYMTGLDQLSYLIAYLSVSGIAYVLRNWWHLQLALSVPWMFVAVALYWLLPESPRWLIAIGRKDEAIVLLKRIAVSNKQPVDNIEEIVDQYQRLTQAENQKRGTFADLFKTSNIRRHAFNMALVWMICSFGFFGVNQYIGRLSGNIYLNVLVAALLHIPGLILTVIAVLKLTRRLTVGLTFGTAGVCLFVLIFIPVESQIARIIVGAFGLNGMFNSFVVIYLYASELFPTVIRNSALGFVSVFARLGGFIAPFVVNIGTEWIYLLIFSVAAFLAVVLCLFLPETKGVVLANHISEAENVNGNKQKTVL